MKLIPCALLVVLIAHGCEGWDQEELDLFDLVEEVEENFYEIMGVEQVQILNVHTMSLARKLLQTLVLLLVHLYKHLYILVSVYKYLHLVCMC